MSVASEEGSSSTSSSARLRKPQSDLDALIAEARNGSREALEKLLEILATHLWRDLNARPRRQAGPSHGSSDLVQDTLVRVREQFARFERDTFADFKQWARAILYRRHLEWTRNHQSRNSERHMRRLWGLMSARVENGATAAHEHAVERRDTLQRIVSAFDSLKESDQFVIRLRLEGLGFREIADMTESTVDAVTKAYHRAIARLRKKLDNGE